MSKHGLSKNSTRFCFYVYGDKKMKVPFCIAKSQKQIEFLVRTDVLSLLYVGLRLL